MKVRNELLTDQAVRAAQARALSNAPKVEVWPASSRPPNNWIYRPALAGYDAYNGLGAAAGGDLWKAANNTVKLALSPGIKAAIDASPLTSKQKALLKNEPLSVFVVAAQFSQDKFIEFIKRVNKGRPKAYNIGGARVTIDPKKSQPAALLAAQFLAVANQNPAKAALTAAQMTFELGVAAPISMLVSGGAEDVNAIIQMNVDAAKGIQKGVQQSWKSLEKAIGFDIPFLGLGAVPAAVPAGAAAGVFGTGLTAAELTGLVTAAVAMAQLLVPALLSLASGAMPQPPTQAQQNAANADASIKVPQAEGAVPPEQKQQIKDAVASKDTILGLPRAVAYGGGAALLLSVLALVVKKARKK